MSAKVSREHRVLALQATGEIVPTGAPIDERVFADRIRWLDEGGLHEVGEYEYSVELEQVAEHIAAAERRGREAERADVLAWFRTDTSDGSAPIPGSLDECALRATLRIADLIEQGKHLRGNR